MTAPADPRVGAIHLELLRLTVCLMRFDELNAGALIRTNVHGVSELIEACRALVKADEAGKG